MTEMTPNPGSRLDRAQSAADQYTPDAAEVDLSQQAPVEGQYVVQTREDRAYYTITRTLAVNAGTSRRILSKNDLRRSAIISCVAGTVILCANSEMAAAAQALALSTTPTTDVPGYYMVAGTPGAAVPWESVDGAFGAATTSGQAIVSIIEQWWRE